MSMAIRAMFSVQNALSTPSGLAGLLLLPISIGNDCCSCARDFQWNSIECTRWLKRDLCTHLDRVCASVCVCAGNSLHLNNWKIHTLGYWIGRKPNRQRAHKCIYGAILNYKNCRTDSRLGLPAELCMCTPPPCAPVDLCIYLKIICLQCTGNGATASVRERESSLSVRIETLLVRVVFSNIYENIICTRQSVEKQQKEFEGGKQKKKEKLQNVVRLWSSLFESLCAWTVMTCI